MLSLGRLKSSFGAPFLLLVTSVYWTQGFRSFVWMGVSFQMKDQLNLSPSASQYVMSIAFIPWSVKPLYGILSDCVPLGGRRRIPYLVISSVLCFLSWVILGLVHGSRESFLQLTMLLTLQNLGAAMADVVVDAMVAETAKKERAQYAGDLQSLSWLAMAFGGIIGSLTGGIALAMFNAGGIFLIFSIFPLLQLLYCFLIDERTLGKGIDQGIESTKEVEVAGLAMATDASEGPFKGNGFDVSFDDLRIADVAQKETKMLTAIMDVSKSTRRSNGAEHAESMARVHELSEDEGWVQVGKATADDVTEKEESSWTEQNATEVTRDLSADEKNEVLGHEAQKLEDNGLHRRKGSSPQGNNNRPIEREPEVKIHNEIGLAPGIRSTLLTLYQAIKQPAIFRPMLWFLIAQAVVPNISTIMFYYQTNVLKLDAAFLGTSRVIGWVGLMLGTFFYNHYLKHVSLRKLFGWVHIGVALLTLTDILLVSGLGTQLGIPNKAFVVGSSALGDAVQQFKFMPFLVLSGQLCPPGIEGTLFALFMSVNNLGATLSSFGGAALSSILQISANEFDNLVTGILIQAASTLLPLMFLFLVPAEITGVSTH
ncbi:hypothetical protein O6H91_10G079000 [Diphasiastrum complanatum]|uniref:Uncharacterized protein n=2 Tax=Diphasiastrum complanatum TaxID=34168 RepID=A0ACC2CIY0_DIPCM|nr:hypothetical protein O6H91_10G079000 [Diphasiastrum complanatum]KAJ7541839.1 hypothetical protein O6H91_10G079000 [Diphasiastrum complanatum]